MRLTILAAALALALPPPGSAAPAAAPAEPSKPVAAWSQSAERLTFTPARLSAPRRPATAEYRQTIEFSHPGEGVDTAIKYQTADEQVFATLYVYYPSVAHTGVQAIATDQAIRRNGTPPAEPAGAAVVAAAGVAAAAQTADYKGYQGALFSKAAFIKAGR